MTQTLVDRLCEDLRRAFRRDSKGTEVAALLGRYAESCEDWRDFVFFSPERYTRNFVDRCGDYELLLLCWEAGQESPIHNHDGQRCWMAVLEGELEEVHYADPAPDRAEPLTQRDAKRFTPGGVAFIDDEIALHLIRPTGEQRGVSLHLYSNAIDQCRVFDPATGASSQVDLSYHSVRGELCQRSAEAVRAEWGAGDAEVPE